MKKLAVLLVLLLCSTHLNSQWVSNYWANGDSPILNSKGLAVVVDDDNYCYVAGYTFSESTGYDIILIKYVPNGDTIFSKTYSGNGTEEDKAFGIVVDQAGFIYIIGQLSIQGKSTELVLLKYSNNGEFLWAQTYGATGTAKPDKGQALALDENGNVYVTGFCTGEDGYKDILVQKYTSNGTLLWTSREDGDGNMDSEGNGIAVNGGNFVFVTGYTTSLNNSDLHDVITLKYTEDGVLKWSKTFNGTGDKDDVAYGIALGDENSIYVAGFTTPGSDTGNTSTLVIKYNKNGSLKWLKTYDSGIQGSSDKAFGIVVDSENRIYITGQTETQSNGLDYLTIRYGHGGAQQWLKNYNGPGNEDDIANAITTLHNGNVVVTGASWGREDNFDYATVIMNKNNGSIYDVFRYGMTGNYNDVAKGVASSENNRIYVTGFSELIVDTPGDSPSAITTLSLISTEDQSAPNNVPLKFTLYQNYPNPFNPSTTIKFDLSATAEVKLIVYDMLGKVVDVLVNNSLDAGSYSITYKNTNLASGIYFYQLTAGEQTDVKKMTLVK